MRLPTRQDSVENRDKVYYSVLKSLYHHVRFRNLSTKSNRYNKPCTLLRK